TAASMAPGLAVDSTTNDKIAVSVALSVIFINSSSLIHLIYYRQRL
ncbi:MAG: hypothetical protein ACI935_004003, partial [Moritella dasanensis]